MDETRDPLCGDVHWRCICSQPPGHLDPPLNAPHLCDCGGSWTADRQTVTYPQLIVEGPLEGLSGPELNAVMGWLGVNGVAFPAPEGGEGAYRCYGEEHGRILYMDTGEVRLRRDPMEVMLRGLSAPWGIGPGTFGDFTRRMALGLPLDDDWDEDDE